MLHIEVLTFEGCPNAPIARERVARALELEQQVAHIENVDVPTSEMANRVRFLGSPSVRVNSKDVEPAAQRRSHYGLMCRTYLTKGRAEGAPSMDLIRAAIRRAASG